MTTQATQTHTYATRPIHLPELRRRGWAQPGLATSGWAVVRLTGDDEDVIEWYADRYVAEDEAALRIVDEAEAQS